MSTSRVKRSYDTFNGEESMMMTSSPHCSPIKYNQQQVQQQQQQQPFMLNNNMQDNNMQQQQQQQQQQQSLDSSSQSSSSSSSSTGFSFGFSPTPTPHFSSLYDAAQPNTSSQLPDTATSSSSSSSSSSHVASYSSPPPSSHSSSHKRFRRPGQQDVSMSDEQENTDTSSSSSNTHQSPFSRLKRPALDELMFVPRHFKKQAIAAALAGPSSSRPMATPSYSSSSSSSSASSTQSAVAACIPPPPSSTGVSVPNYQHQLFTYDQVASIVRNALEMREEQIREEYNRTLQDLLREQFENFSMFNRDYISRNMKSLDTNEDDYSNSYYS